MFSLLPVSLWCPANTSDSQARGSGFKNHFLQFFILNSVEFYRISLGKTRIGMKCIPDYTCLIRLERNSFTNLIFMAMCPFVVFVMYQPRTLISKPKVSAFRPITNIYRLHPKDGEGNVFASVCLLIGGISWSCLWSCLGRGTPSSCLEYSSILFPGSSPLDTGGLYLEGFSPPPPDTGELYPGANNLGYWRTHQLTTARTVRLLKSRRKTFLFEFYC